MIHVKHNVVITNLIMDKYAKIVQLNVINVEILETNIVLNVR